MKTVKITKRENYTNIINVLTEIGGHEDLVAFAEAEIALLDKKAAKAKENASKRRAKEDAFLDLVKEVLTDEFATIDEIVDKVDNEDFTNSKAATRLNALVTDGFAEKGEIKIPGTEGRKTRKLVAYRILNN